MTRWQDSPIKWAHLEQLGEKRPRLTPMHRRGVWIGPFRFCWHGLLLGLCKWPSLTDWRKHPETPEPVVAFGWLGLEIDWMPEEAAERRRARKQYQAWYSDLLALDPTQAGLDYVYWGFYYEEGYTPRQALHVRALRDSAEG